jgi:hypothetical protein
MIVSGKEVVEPDEPVIYVSCESVWRDVTRKQQLREFRTLVSVVGVPSTINRLQYAPGENLDVIFGVCSIRFMMAHPHQDAHTRCWIQRLPTGEAIGIVFVRDLVPDFPTDEESQIDDTDLSMDVFSDDEEWGEEDDYDY